MNTYNEIIKYIYYIDVKISDMKVNLVDTFGRSKFKIESSFKEFQKKTKIK